MKKLFDEFFNDTFVSGCCPGPVTTERLNTRIYFIFSYLSSYYYLRCNVTQISIAYKREERTMFFFVARCFKNDEISEHSNPFKSSVIDVAFDNGIEKNFQWKLCARFTNPS